MRRVCGFSTRLLLLVAGSLTIAVSVAVTLWTGLGPGPLDVFIGAVRTHTGVPLSVAVWMVVGSLIALAWALGRRPGFGTLVGPLVVGVVMQSTLSVLNTFEAPDALIVRMVIQLLAIGAIGVGAGALIVSGLGAGSGELLTSAASRLSGHPERWVRLALEVSWLVIGVALGGPAGLGTVMIALTLGVVGVERAADGRPRCRPIAQRVRDLGADPVAGRPLRFSPPPDTVDARSCASPAFDRGSLPGDRMEP